MTWTVPRIWEGGRCIIIGGGPSMLSQFNISPELVARVRDRSDPTGPDAYSSYMEPIHGEHVIGVNDAYLIGTWIDVCHFGDGGWYRVHRERLAAWPNLKVTHCPAFADDRLASREGIKYLRRDPDKKLGLSQNPRRLSWNFNTGSSAIGLAVHFGVRQIILLGFDMSHEGAATHWHFGHGHGPRKTYARFLRGMPVIAKDARVMGVEIINCSPGTAIADFPATNLNEILQRG